VWSEIKSTANYRSQQITTTEHTKCSSLGVSAQDPRIVHKRADELVEGVALVVLRARIATLRRERNEQLRARKLDLELVEHLRRSAGAALLRDHLREVDAELLVRVAHAVLLARVRRRAERVRYGDLDVDADAPVDGALRAVHVQVREPDLPERLEHLARALVARDADALALALGGGEERVDEVEVRIRDVGGAREAQRGASFEVVEEHVEVLVLALLNVRRASSA